MLGRYDRGTVGAIPLQATRDSVWLAAALAKICAADGADMPRGLAALVLGVVTAVCSALAVGAADTFDVDIHFAAAVRTGDPVEGLRSRRTVTASAGPGVFADASAVRATVSGVPGRERVSTDDAAAVGHASITLTTSQPSMAAVVSRQSREMRRISAWSPHSARMYRYLRVSTMRSRRTR